MRYVFKLGRLYFRQPVAMEQTFHLEDVIDYFQSCFYLIILFLTKASEVTGI